MKRIGIFLLVAMAVGCAVPKTEGAVRIGSYNLENLFDSSDQGTEYPDYRVSSGRWSEELSLAKMMNLARVIRESGGADIWVFQEVENQRVLEQLVHLFLRGEGYEYVFCTEYPDSAVQIGVVSRFPISKVFIHCLDQGPLESFSQRPVTEIHLETGFDPIILFCCHWKSRRGGPRLTEELRRSAAYLTSRAALGILEDDPAATVFIVGDLNESWDEESRVGGLYPTALGRRGALASGALGVPGLWFDPWCESPEPGSYFYNGRWESLDHIIMSSSLGDGTGWEFAGFEVFHQDFMETRFGSPMRFNRKSLDGYSDHFPVRVDLVLTTSN